MPRVPDSEPNMFESNDMQQQNLDLRNQCSHPESGPFVIWEHLDVNLCLRVQFRQSQLSFKCKIIQILRQQKSLILSFDPLDISTYAFLATKNKTPLKYTRDFVKMVFANDPHTILSNGIC